MSRSPGQDVQRERRRLIVTSCRVLRSGTNAGGEWALYAVEATTRDDRKIRARLLSFEELPVGEVEFEVERQDHAQHGTSYLLRRPRQKIGPRIAVLERSVRNLASRVEQLERAPVSPAGGEGRRSRPDASGPRRPSDDPYDASARGEP